EGGDWLDDLLPAGGPGQTRGMLGTARRLRRGGGGLAGLVTNPYPPFLPPRPGRRPPPGGLFRDPGGAPPPPPHPRTPARRARRPGPSRVLDDYNGLAECAGCPPPPRRMELFTTPADEEAAGRVWRRAGLADFREVVCLNPGAAFGSAKHWPAAYFADLARSL